MHLQPSLVQIFVQFLQMESHFDDVVQIFELKRVRAAPPKGHPFAPLGKMLSRLKTRKINIPHFFMDI